MGDKIPKIFISYSWIVSERVLELAERFVANGVDVILDKWDLKEGQDKYAFMEKCVVDPEIDKVLLICDKSYCDKANLRAGGVGDETVIISPEIYNQVNQEKFLPIIFEVDEYNKPYIPAYIKSRIYFDLSTEDDQYEVEYEKLLRNIYNKPLYKKPALGKKPDWLETETVDLSPIRDLIRQTRGYTGGNKTKADFLLRKAVASFITALLGYASPRIDSETLLKKNRRNETFERFV
ncbi:toll/interleukin-1 receptor domain-containing protein [Christensenella intestinihominis]|uniref:toll/interleukin-1 receptor domain-containing protein n=1 Tax=Christensenella intestinihominis TaxID=1851429 RepID=UPI0008369644|nr:toll/interleukin-1 receptor domain-containing protein [Christensenella intestinihominis]